MKAKRQSEAVLNSATMLDGTGGHVTIMAGHGLFMGTDGAKERSVCDITGCCPKTFRGCAKSCGDRSDTLPRTGVLAEMERPIMMGTLEAVIGPVLGNGDMDSPSYQYQHLTSERIITDPD